MPFNNDHIAHLIIKHLQETITADETQTLEQWIAASDDNRAKFTRLTNGETLSEDLMAHGLSDQQIKDQVYSQLPEVQDALTVIVTPKRNWMRWASVAAAVLVIAFAGIWLLRSKETSTTDGSEQQVPVATTNIPPGGNKATLTLADGTVIDLDKAGNGTIATEGKTKVNKKEDGQLEYQLSKGNKQSAITYNMLATPRGGQYQLLLPDGSKVWLNAASSIKYPTEFAGNERRVEVTGETYFEIARNQNKPFRVTVLPPAGGAGRGGEIEVVGTHFNVNAYGDEQPIVTTLLEGKIKISPVEVVSKQSAGVDMKNHKPQTTNYKLLLPGEEAQIGDKADIKVRKNVDTESAVSWMKGFFDFQKASMKTVMLQVSRWYNVDVQYKGAIPAQTFEGNIDRNIPLNELLMLLQQMGPTKFTIEGRTVKVQ
jgi:transmembrane sensor